MRKNKKMRKLFKAAYMCKPKAMYDLGLRYEVGNGVPEDRDTALLLMSEAADLGYEPAVMWLKDYCFDDDALVQAES